MPWKLFGTISGEIETGARDIVCGDLLKDAGLPLIGVKLADAHEIVSQQRRGSQELHHAVGVGVGERLEEHGVDH